jgi:hypothetical protein
MNDWHSQAIEMVRHGQKAEALKAVGQLVALFATCPFPGGEKFSAQYCAIEAQLLEDGCCLLEVREALEALTAPVSRFVADVLWQIVKDAAALKVTVVDVIEAGSPEELLQKMRAAAARREGKTDLAALYQVCLN